MSFWSSPNGRSSLYSSSKTLAQPAIGMATMAPMRPNEGREFETFALNFWRNEVGFDLEINNGVDEEADAGWDTVEGEK